MAIKTATTMPRNKIRNWAHRVLGEIALVCREMRSRFWGESDRFYCLRPGLQFTKLNDFFGLLRSLHEEAKMGVIWKNFRLGIVHSTEIYIPLDVNSSPFNVGLAIDLPDFTPEQVQDLA